MGPEEARSPWTWAPSLLVVKAARAATRAPKDPRADMAKIRKEARKVVGRKEAKRVMEVNPQAEKEITDSGNLLRVGNVEVKAANLRSVHQAVGMWAVLPPRTRLHRRQLAQVQVAVHRRSKERIQMVQLSR